MRIVRHLESTRVEFRAPVVTLGNFDGVHVGHRAILERLVARAEALGGEAVVITFFPHPAAVLAPGKAPPPIASLRGRLDRLREARVGAVVLQRFTRAFSRLTPEDFIRRYLVAGLRASKVVVGHSVNFGRDRKGTAATLEEAGPRSGFEVEVVGPVTAEGIEVSSTEIRRRLAAGEILLAAKLLGRPYSIDGRIEVGKRRGRSLGFPTANVRPRVAPIVPDGVYAVAAHHRGGARPGVANIGKNPTFGAGTPRTVEVHLFDFDGDLYGERLRVALVDRIRGETRFASPEALVEQIHEDVRRAREILARTAPA